MKKKMWLLGVAALVLGLLAVMTDGGAVADDGQPTPTPSEIMKKAHAKGGLKGAIQTGLKANPVDWDKTQKQTKEYADLAGALGKNTPPKGDKASWEKLTKALADTVKEVNTAAEKKDAPTAQTALGKIGQMCMPCHTAHRGG
jgi:cytochrome c556